MPLEYEIDHARKLVIATGRGIVTDTDFFDYQKTVWSRADVVGYDEMVDMTTVTKIDPVDPEKLRALAALSASMDDQQHTTKLAIVAREVLHFGLGRMYQAYRELSPQSKKQVSVFDKQETALQWLGKTEASPGSLKRSPESFCCELSE